MDFSGKTVLITGGTRGIGAAMAQAFEQAGARLILTGSHADQVERLNQELPQGSRRTYVAADFSQDASLQEFLEYVAGLERLDVCVNNAGINRLGPIWELPARDYLDIQRVNLEAPFLISRQACRLMRRQNCGRIVNIASIWSVITKPGRVSYTTTKAGLAGMTRTLAVDMAPHNILVNTVSPGFVETDLTKSTNTPQEIEAMAAQVPAGRLAQPQEIARVVLFLASDLNTYLTGQNLVVDGGFTIV